jgi:HK97 family phage major capsid protein
MHRKTTAGFPLRADGSFPPLAGGDPALSPTLKDRLKEVESDIASLRDDRVSAIAERDAARDAFAKLDDLTADSDEFKTAQEAVAKVGTIEDTIADRQSVQVGILKMLGQHDEVRARADDEAQRHPLNGEHQPAGWNSKALFERDGIKEALAQAAHTKSRFGGIELGQVCDREALKADVAPTANMRRAADYGILPQLFRPLRVLDLIPTGTMDGNVLPYTQESGNFLAAETVEGAAKPEDGVVYTDAAATAQTIAAWLKIRKQALADVPALQSIIDARLRYSVQRRLEGQVLNGNGTDPNIRGILATAGLGAVAYAAGQLAADQVLRAMTTVLLADAQATGIVMNPLDWQDALLAKAAGDGHYYSGGPFSVTPAVMWGVPLVPSPVIPAGTVLVGDFAIGAQLFIREGVNVLLSDSDQDDFIKNKVTLLGEMRAALAVWRPSAFATVDLTA